MPVKLPVSLPRARTDGNRWENKTWVQTLDAVDRSAGHSTDAAERGKRPIWHGSGRKRDSVVSKVALS